MTNGERLVEILGTFGFNLLIVAISIFLGLFFIYGITHQLNKNK